MVRVLDLCFPWRLVLFARPWLCWCLAAGFCCLVVLVVVYKDVCELFLGESYHKERIIGQANFYRVPTLCFTVASTSVASRLFRLGEACGKPCLLVVSAQISLGRVSV